MKKLFRRLSYIWNRRQAERDLTEEMTAHREQLEPARAAAFGAPLRLREESRDAWGFAWLDQLSQDLRYGVRSLSKSRGFTLAATLILTLGVGLNLTLFQLLNATFLQPIALKDPTTLVRFIHRAEGKGGAMTSSTVPLQAAEYIRDHNSILSAAIFEMSFDLAWGDDGANRMRAALVSTNWFQELGYSAAQGRVFRPEIDDSTGAPPVVVISDAFWRNRLGGDPEAVGSTMRINNRQVTVIGVAPASFPGMRQDITDAWIPLRHGEYFNAPVTTVNLYARVKPGLSADAVRDATRAPLEGARELLQTQSGWRAWLEPFYGTRRFEPTQDVTRRWTIIALLGGLTFLVLLVACANLGNLILSRAVGRVREFSVRTALGASRWRVIRQLLTECLLLACLGCICGSALGYAAATWIARVTGLPPYLDFSPDWRTLLAAAALALFAMLAVGFLPAWKISRQDLTASMKDGGQNASSGLDRARLRQMLLGAQVAGSCLLLVVAGLAFESLRALLENGPGFDYRNIAVMDAALSRYGIKAPEALVFWSTLKRSLLLLPEGEGVALVSVAPLNRDGLPNSVLRFAPGLIITNERVEPDFFQAMGIPILAGRNFTPDETPSQAVIVSRKLAVTMFGTIGDAVGKEYPNKAIIVGVAADARLGNISSPESAELYAPLQGRGIVDAQLLVRARTDPRVLLAPMRQAARAVDDRVLPEVRLMASDYDAKLTPPRLARNISALMALLALTLACLGVFGVVSYGAALRTKEIGIRMALGAPRTSIIRILLRQLTWPSTLGMLLGGGGAAALAKVLAGAPLYLTGLNATVLAAAVGFLAATAALAALLPAFRALRRDPLEALRYE